MSLFCLLSFESLLSAQSSTPFSFQYWDSLYVDAIEQNHHKIDTIVQQLLTEAELSEDNSAKSYSKYILANEFFRIGAFESASDHNQQSSSICLDLQGEPINEECTIILERIYFLNAKLHQVKGNLNQASFYYKRVIELSDQRIDKQRLHCEIGIGEIYLSQGNYVRAHQYFEKARKLAINNELGNQITAMVLQETAELMSEVGLDSLSEQNLVDAEQIALEYADTTLLVKISSLRGRNFLRAKKYNDAALAYQESLTLATQKKDLELEASSQLGLGKIAYARAETEVAILHLEEAIRLAEWLGTKNISAESQTYLGKIKLEYDQTDEALTLCNEAYDLSHSLGIKRIHLLSCNCLKQIYEQKNEWQAAYILQQEERKIEEQMNEDLLLQKISSARFEQSMANLKDQQAREREQLESEKSWSDQLVSLQGSRIFLLSILFALSLVLAFFLFRLFNSKKLHNTELQTLNHQLHFSNHKLETSNNELNTTNETLQQTNQALNNFAAVAAHDLKGPLRTINSFTQLLKRRLGDKVGTNEEEYFQYINKSTKKLATLIDDLLNFSSLGKQMTAPKAIDLNIILNDVKANLSNTVKEKNAQIVHSSLPITLTNASLMTQLFQNLISNSLKFTHEDRTAYIKIHTSPLGTNRMKFYIQDNGIGIAEDQQEQVFELFTRLNSKEDYEGSGVGLATCRKIVQHYGGVMSIESTENVETTIIFDLPLE